MGHTNTSKWRPKLTKPHFKIVSDIFHVVRNSFSLVLDQCIALLIIQLSASWALPEFIATSSVPMCLHCCFMLQVCFMPIIVSLVCSGSRWYSMLYIFLSSLVVFRNMWPVCAWVYGVSAILFSMMSHY